MAIIRIILYGRRTNYIHAVSTWKKVFASISICIVRPRDYLNLIVRGKSLLILLCLGAFHFFHSYSSFPAIHSNHFSYFVLLMQFLCLPQMHFAHLPNFRYFVKDSYALIMKSGMLIRSISYFYSWYWLI